MPILNLCSHLYSRIVTPTPVKVPYRPQSDPVSPASRLGLPQRRDVPSPSHPNRCSLTCARRGRTQVPPISPAECLAAFLHRRRAGGSVRLVLCRCFGQRRLALDGTEILSNRAMRRFPCMPSRHREDTSSRRKLSPDGSSQGSGLGGDDHSRPHNTSARGASAGSLAAKRCGYQRKSGAQKQNQRE